MTLRVTATVDGRPPVGARSDGPDRRYRYRGLRRATATKHNYRITTITYRIR